MRAPLTRLRWLGLIASLSAALSIIGLLRPWQSDASPPKLPCVVQLLCPPTTSTTQASSTTTQPTTTTTTTGGGGGPRPIPAPVYGVTVDDISNVSQIVAGLQAFETAQPGHMATVRVYFDVNEPPGYYLSAVQQLRRYAYVMGEILDSSDMPKTGPGAEHQRVASYLSALGSYVDVWEVGNEINGDWTCSGSSPCTASGYQTGAGMVIDAFDQVTAAGLPSALTFWYNAGCPSDPSEPGPLQYADAYLAGNSTLADGLGYVFISYYQTECNGTVLTSSEVSSFMQQLGNRFPNARTGFGEVGLPNPATATTRSQAEQIIQHYYGLDPGLASYVGGYFYWYFTEDALPYQSVTGQTNPIWSALNSAFATEK